MISGEIPVQRYSDSMWTGFIHEKYDRSGFRRMMGQLQEMLKSRKISIFKEREDRIYGIIAPDVYGGTQPLFLKLDVYTRKIRIKKWVNNYVMKSRAEKSWKAAWELIRIGLQTPMPVAFLEKRRWGGLYEALSLTEYLEGALPLQKLWDQGIPSDERKSLSSLIASRVAYLHQSGLVHGDLKPSNLLIRKERDGGYDVYFTDLESLFRTSKVQPSHRVRDLAALLSSFLGRAESFDQIRFFANYLRGEQVPRAEKRGLAKKILEEAKRRKGKIQLKRAALSST
jgi:tRNA A-37 threonylcarbamoyl transferase component Bud32